MFRALVLVSFVLLASIVRADDRGACGAGDTRACARIGELKSLGALKADGTKDVDKLVEVCGAALGTAHRFEDFSRPCKQLFKPEMQNAMAALVHMPPEMLEQVLGDAYAEYYCPDLPKPVDGCVGKKAANFSARKPREVRAAVKALNAAALEKELGAAQAKGLAAKFDAAFARVFGAVK